MSALSATATPSRLSRTVGLLARYAFLVPTLALLALTPVALFRLARL